MFIHIWLDLDVEVEGDGCPLILNAISVWTLTRPFKCCDLNPSPELLWREIGFSVLNYPVMFSGWDSNPRPAPNLNL